MVIDVIQQIVAVISTVCQYIASFYIDMFQNGYGKINVIALSFAEHDINWITISIYCCMDFGAGSAPAMSDFVWNPPFFAPALCW